MMKGGHLQFAGKDQSFNPLKKIRSFSRFFQSQCVSMRAVCCTVCVCVTSERQSSCSLSAELFVPPSRLILVCLLTSSQPYTSFKAVEERESSYFSSANETVL